MSEQTSDFCAAYACPMLGVYGVSGKWYCSCHHTANPALNDAITAELHRQKPMVDQIISLRRLGRVNGELESKLIDVVREIGQQMPLSSVIGPSHGEPHFAETYA
ncbi:hypothetical protein PQQ63_15260 [Paraburkholderia metrosideri]|uniref:Uncharacterized protein n=1 Tax=Paraburkholderia metrosideri TaxID=580937 RepID=A0ABW9DTS8_9BURK